MTETSPILGLNPISHRKKMEGRAQPVNSDENRHVFFAHHSYIPPDASPPLSGTCYVFGDSFTQILVPGPLRAAWAPL